MSLDRFIVNFVRKLEDYPKEDVLPVSLTLLLGDRILKVNTKPSGLQRVTNLTIAGEFCITPKLALEILLDLSPLHILAEQEGHDR
ncbi:hypothetical protein Trydic_g20667 [Trypoxylus dichotomus]